MAALVSLISFVLLFKLKRVDLTSILDEIEDIVDYARTYLWIGCDSYKKAWYQLCLSPDTVDKYIVSNLLFRLRFSTAKVEHFFSTLKIITNDKRTNLSSTLNDLLEVNTEGPTRVTFQQTRQWISGGVIPEEELTKTPKKSIEDGRKAPHMHQVILKMSLKLN